MKTKALLKISLFSYKVFVPRREFQHWNLGRPPCQLTNEKRFFFFQRIPWTTGLPGTPEKDDEEEQEVAPKNLVNNHNRHVDSLHRV